MKRLVFSSFSADMDLSTACCVICRRHLKYEFHVSCDCGAACCSFCKDKLHDGGEICEFLKNAKSTVPSLDTLRHVLDITKLVQSETKKNGVEYLMLLEHCSSQTKYVIDNYRDDMQSNVYSLYYAAFLSNIVNRSEMCLVLSLFNHARILLDYCGALLDKFQNNINAGVCLTKRISIERALLVGDWLCEVGKCDVASNYVGQVWSDRLSRQFDAENFDDDTSASIYDALIINLYRSGNYSLVYDQIVTCERLAGKVIHTCFDANERIVTIFNIVNFKMSKHVTINDVKKCLEIVFCLGTSEMANFRVLYEVYMNYCHFFVDMIDTKKRVDFLPLLTETLKKCKDACVAAYSDESVQYANVCRVGAIVWRLRAQIFADTPQNNKKWKDNVMRMFENAIDTHFECIGLYRHMFGEERSVFCDHPHYPETLRECLVTAEIYQTTMAKLKLH